MTFADVLSDQRRWSVEQADCLPWLRSLPDNSLDLVITSPPYELARDYLEKGKNLGIARRTEDWVKWMVEVITECSRVCKGLIAFVVEGQTKDFRYSAGPLLLAADLHRAGFCLRKPCIFRRVGVPGGGGGKSDHAANGGSAEWLRNDWEPIICVTRGGRLPWADALACGHTPKFAPGGEFSNRQVDGSRVNAFGVRTDAAIGTRKSGDKGKINDTYRARDAFGGTGYATSGEGRKANGQRKTRTRKPNFRHSEDPTSPTDHDRLLDLAIANPGNVIQQRYTAEEVAAIMGQPSDVVDCIVGGGVMGHPLAHENEAPFPLDLATFFVRSFCPPGGVCADPFSGSGTVLHACIENDRRFIGVDLRQSQVDLAIRRAASITPSLPGFA